MALHPDFPTSPYAILDPEIRWFPADEAMREKTYDKLLPPLVVNLRRRVKEWRDAKYAGASETTLTLLKWWFESEHLMPRSDGTMFPFRYYFCQREAVETVIYLTEIVKVKDKYDLIRFDASGLVSAGMFDETWRRYVVKMATGSGKTKILSLILAWSYFHKLYEEGSPLARNFLIITPNIIVLDRIRSDFDRLKIFYEDPILPDNGVSGHDWRNDFQLTLHIQDEVGIIRKTGNIFLTNIHRVYDSANTTPCAQDEDTKDYFLGQKPTGATTDSKVDLSQIVRDIDELVILNDEAHHIHNQSLAWFQSIRDIHNNLKFKGRELSLQLDVTATPRHDNGGIFVQTICDYPLVEAIHQNIVKHPTLPDSASRAKLVPRQSSKYTEQYQDYIHLGVLEWRKAYTEHQKMSKKAVLFVMTDDTKTCDEVAEYLHQHYPEFEARDSVLVIHTKDNGEISESASGKKKEELVILRKAANEIDQLQSPYKAIISVLMLKEGWDVKNVTTIVGLRAYVAQSNILPEQTLGRGLRRMYRGEDIAELVSVVGTDAFMDFVESIKSEGVDLEYRKMGEHTAPTAPIVVEVDHENTKKDIDKLDINIAVLTPRIYREYRKLTDLDLNTFGHKRIELAQFSDDEVKQIVFRDITSGDITHITELESSGIANYQNVVGYFARQIMKELRLVSGYDVLYGKMKEFIASYLFTSEVNLESLNTLRNLSELEASKTIIETFKKQINALTVVDKGDARIQNSIKVGSSRPFVAKEQPYLIPQKSVFNKIVGDSHFEFEFAAFLESCDDIVSYAKNYYAVHFKIDYQNASGEIRDYYPDFIVKKSENEIYIVETKGQEDLDALEKKKRAIQWCEDVNAEQSKVRYQYLYITQEQYEKYRAKSFEQLVSTVRAG